MPYRKAGKGSAGHFLAGLDRLLDRGLVRFRCNGFNNEVSRKGLFVVNAYGHRLSEGNANLCPGDYLYNRHGEIAAEVNRRLGASAERPAENKPATGEVIHTVKAGETLSKIAQKYGTTYQKIAAYNRIASANLIRVGQKIKIPADTQAAQSFKKGDKVKVLKAVTYTGKAFKTYYDKYDVIEADGDRVVIGIGKTVTAAVNAANLKKA